MTTEDVLNESAEEFLADLIRHVDPLAVTNEDEGDRQRRLKRVNRRIKVAMCEYNQRPRSAHEGLSFEEWVKESVMTTKFETSPVKTIDHLLAITLELAGTISPEKCGTLNSRTYDFHLATDEQQEVIQVASEFVKRICLITEQEYAAYLFRDKAQVA